jgi:hypothetical protein
MIRRLKKIANVFKPNKFHFALVDYLAEELKSNNISCRKKTSYIKIKLASKIEEKYDHLIIDCFNGGIYLRGDEVRDKKILKLNRFYGDREADAMHCARGGAKSIIKLLSRLQNKDSMIVEATDNLDDNNDYEERTANIIDMRKIAYHDTSTRDKAILYINGEIVEGNTHNQALSLYYDNGETNDYSRKSFENHIKHAESSAVAHMVNKEIYIEPDSLINVTISEVTNALKEKYPEYNIYLDNEEVYDLKPSAYQKVARKMNDMRKTAKRILKDFRKLGRLKKKADINGRDFAISIINGKVYTADIHGQTMSNFLKDLGITDIEFYDRYELEDSLGKGFIIDFAAAHAVGNKIYIEPDTLMNMDLNEAINILSNEFKGYEIYNANTKEKIAKIAKLKKIANHDDYNRDYAIVYINGEFYEDIIHGCAIKQYLKNHGIKELDNKSIRPGYSNQKEDDYLEDLYNMEEIIFAHKLEDDKSIYIEQNSLKNIDLNQAAAIFKEHYPDYNIYNDDSYKGDEDYDEDGNNNYKKIARLKKLNEHGDFDRDWAVVYINGEFYEDGTHASAVNQYLKNHDIKELNDDFIRPGYSNQKDDSHLEDLDTMKDNVEELAFAHKLDNDKCIYIEEDSLQNIDINTVGNLFKKEYPDYDIYNDDSYEGEDYDEDGNNNYQKIARLKKVSRDISNRDVDGAIIYIDGEVLSGHIHTQILNDYLHSKAKIKLNDDYIRPYAFDSNMEQDPELYYKEELDDIENIKNNIKQLAFAHKDSYKNIIYIEKDTLYNIDLNTVANAIKNKYPDFEICIDETNEKVAKKDMRKIAYHDINTRNSVVVYINNQFIETDTVSNAINQYFNTDEDIDENDVLYYLNKQLIMKFIIGHKIYNAIYIDSNSLIGTSMQDAANLFKQQYSNCTIYDDNADNKKVARLKKLATDIEDRDFEGAIVYIDGEVYTARTHATAIDNYIYQKFNQELSNTWSRPNLKDNDNSFLSEERIKDKEIIKNNIKQLGFAHKVSKIPDVEGDVDIIFVEQNSLYNVDINIVANAIKNKYPDFEIYIDETDEKVAKK